MYSSLDYMMNDSFRINGVTQETQFDNLICYITIKNDKGCIRHNGW